MPHNSELRDEAQGRPWAITDDGAAAWAVDKVLGARERLARIKAACQLMIQDAERQVADAEARFLPALEAWALANPPRKGKTIRLPTGSLSFRTVPGGHRVVDAEAALAWARAYLPAAVVVSERLDAAAVREYVHASGEIPPGVERVPEHERFGVA